MRAVLPIAQLTLREAVRNKVFVNLAVFAALMVGLALLMTGLTVGQHQRIIHTLSFGTLSVVGNLIAVFLGAGLIANEVERKSLYAIVSRPIGRWTVVIGRYLGLAWVLALNTAGGGLLITVILAMGDQVPSEHFVLGLFLIYLEMLLVLSISVLFSSFSTPTLSATFSFCFMVIGRMSPELIDLLPVAESEGLRTLMRFTYSVLPNLARLDPMALVLHGSPLPGHIAALTAYALAYTSLLLTAACWVFTRRDLK
ncbi:MAG: hypothetical protein CMH55_04865 [Myxococcales bacterium]|nr:hypothetical protein [Myxococcales bacterium]|tara:strand:+ start:302 stop:1066 length:765 start_codon:yes stop_codon:yes gene_type:complete